MIRQDTYIELVNHVLDLYVGDRYNKPYLGILDTVRSATLVSTERPEGDVLQEFTCESGTISQRLVVSATNAGNGYTTVFNECLLAGVLYNGQISGQDGGFSFTFSTLEENEFVTQSHPDLVTTMSGAGVFQRSESTMGPRHVWTASLSVKSRSIDGDLEFNTPLSTFEFSTVGGRDHGALSGDLSVRSDITDGRLLTASTPVAFDYLLDLSDVPEISQEKRNAWNFTSGQLQLLGEDGSSVLLDADTGDDETVSVTLTSHSGVERFIAPWSHWQRTLRFDSYPRESLDWISPVSAANPDPDPDMSPGITTENYTALLDHVFDIFAGHGIIEPVTAAGQILFTGEVQGRSVERGLVSETRVCSPEGSAVATRVDKDMAAFPQDFRIDFNGCHIAEYQFNGQVRGQEIRTVNHVRTLEADGVEWLDGDGETYRMHGSTEHTLSTVDDVEVCQWDVGMLNLASGTAEQDGVVLENYGSSFVLSDPQEPSLVINGSLNVVSPTTEGHVLFADAFELGTTVSDADAGLLFTEGNLSLSTWSGFVIRSTLTLTSNEVNESLIVIENSLGRFEIREPWTGFRARLPGIVETVCKVE